MNFIDRLNERIGRAVAWLTLAMVLVTATVVVLRYFFNVGFIWMQESVTWMHAMVFMLGAACTLGADEHVRVDIFYRRCSPRRRALIDVLGGALFLLPCMGLVLWAGLEYAAGSWAIQERSREAGGLAALYLLKSVIAVAAALLILQGVAQIARGLRTLAGRTVDPLADKPSNKPADRPADKPADK
jgi:TRAP-type mannitol/chloroaromatic compound transport system permease small subunit